MWNQQTDMMFLELREDAVLIFEKENRKLLYCNTSAKKIFADADSNTVFSDLFSNPAIENLVQSTISSGKISTLTLDEPIWFPQSAVMHAVELEWEQKSAFAVTIDKRSYGPPPEAMQMMKAVLTSAYFTALRVNLENGSASVISETHVLMNTQANFSSFAEYIRLYAEAVIHPEDRAQFLAAFSEEQLNLFVEANTTPACTVRRQSEEEYRWASFSLSVVNSGIVLLFGKDSNEQHVQQETSARYCSELKELSLRNQYIVSGVSDIFRLMLHIDLRTGETIVCSLHPELMSYYSLDMVYQFEDISKRLMEHVHPDDRSTLASYSTVSRLKNADNEEDHRVILEYRRVAPQQDPNINARWTRSIITKVAFENDAATEAIYVVQDVDAQKRKEIEAKKRNDSLSSRFHTLIRNRYVWFIESNYERKVATCYHITNHMIMQPMECPFGQFFERMIMPHCHPEDFKKAAMVMLPQVAEAEYLKGKRQLSTEYRHKTEDGWRYVCAEIYLEKDEEGVLHALTYISDIHDEVQKKDDLINSEHEQLVLRRKFGMMIQDSFLSVSEVDLDADTISFYKVQQNDFVLKQSDITFSEYCEQYPEKYVHPGYHDSFREIFSHAAILRAARENKGFLKHLFPIDIDGQQNYHWCSVGVKFFCDANGRRYAMTYIEDVNDEITEKDTMLKALSKAKQELQANIREQEQARIQKAHVFLNIASTFQLSLNQIYGTLDKLEHDLPENEELRKSFRTMYTAYDHLSTMCSCSKDVLLLENNQLTLMKEPTSLFHLLEKIRMSSGNLFTEKGIKLYSYVTNVTDEYVICDSSRITFLLDNIFFNLIRSMPDNAEISLQLAESRMSNEKGKAMYEFSLITKGDSFSQDVQSSMMRPIPKNDPMRSIEDAFVLHQPDYQQPNIYLSKRLVALMHGELKYVPMPDHMTGIRLCLPLEYLEKPVIYPVSQTFGKRAIVWDSKQSAAISTMEMLRESGFRMDCQSQFANICAVMQLSVNENDPYCLLILRQSDLNAADVNALEKISTLLPDITVFSIRDEIPSPEITIPEQMHFHYLKTPLFRSVLASQLQDVFGKNAE
ncbi:MAG: hypothetical protein MJ071_03000 [Oscillospiraceae bacterium]|nr:hypothetical protein [Oscillospiraceae bacterium]